MRSTDPIRVASVCDPAVDVYGMKHNVELYAKTRNEKLLKLKPGSEPIWFHVQRPNANMFMTWVHAAESVGERYRRAFQLCVSKIENITLVDGTEKRIHTPSEQQQTPTGVVLYWTDLEVSQIPLVYIDEIGSVAFDRGYLDPKAEASYRLPHSVASALGRRISQDAAAHVARLRSLRSAARRGQQTGEPGDLDIDVTVTE